MIKQGFHIGNRNWWVMVYYDIRSEADLNEVFEVLMASGCSDDMAQKACINLSRYNTGYTFTNFDEHSSILLISKATSSDQMFDTIVHEMKHLSEHIGEYYGVNPNTELSAYLQGEVGRQMWPAAAYVLCPRCGQH